MVPLPLSTLSRLERFMNLIQKVALGSLAALFLALAPVPVMASKTATVARTRDVVYHDRTPRVHDGTPKQHHHHNKNQ
jgi:hypothetical protein